MGRPMTIRKVTGLEGGFSIVPNATLNDTLSWEAIGLLAYLCSKPDDWEVCVKQLVNQSKKCRHPSGRDKTYRILNELQAAGYLRKVKARTGGRFTGVEYVVSPTKIAEFAEKIPVVNSPLTDLPETDLPDTANPTQQSKDSNKERIKQTGEQDSPENVPAKKKRKKHDYPSDFEAFFKLYPKTHGSKLEALKVWKRLNGEEKNQLYASITHYKALLSRESWRKPMIPARYIREEHFVEFYTPEQVLKPAESVFIKGKAFSPETLKELCKGYYSGSEWKYDQLLGPAPDQSNTLIPAEIEVEAKKLANGKA